MRILSGLAALMLGLASFGAHADVIMSDAELLAASQASTEPAQRPVMVSVVEKGGDWGFRIEGMVFPEGRLGKQMDAAIAEGKRRFTAEPRFVELNSSGGLHGDAKVVAGIIHLSRMNTRVLSDNECSSACVLMLMAGHKRSVHEKSYIGLHQHLISETHNMTESQAVQEVMFDYFRFAALGEINPHLLGHMVSVSHDKIAQLPHECVVGLKLDNMRNKGDFCSYTSAGLFPVLGTRPFREIPAR